MVAASASLSRAPAPLRVGLWVVQSLLALAFLFAGVMKTMTPIEELVPQMAWAGAVPAALVRFIGLAEFAGGLGLLLPALTRIKPILTPIAASGLLLVMVIAAVFHVARGEGAFILPNIILGALAAFVAIGRFKLAPIAPRV